MSEMCDTIFVLGVDDKVENLLVLEHILEELPICFIKASSSKEALASLFHHEVALILMDGRMQEIDDYETAVRIRGSSKTEQIPIIFVTADNPGSEQIFQGYHYAAVDYLFKPVNPDILRSKVTVFTELYRQKRAVLKQAAELEKARSCISLQHQALLESEMRFRTAFEQSFQFMAILDPHGRVLELNRLAKKLCGDSPLETVGQYLWNVCWLGQEEENLKLQDAIDRAAAGECVTDEAAFTDVGGLSHVLLRAVSPVKNERGEIRYITVQGHDITRKVEAEKEKRALESLLRQAQKMEALGTLAGGIAHDFNNILGVIIGYTDLAEKGTDADTLQKQYLRQIATAGSKAKELVKQILSFSRQGEVERVVLNPASIIFESIKLLRASIPSTIEILQDIDRECGSILVDPIQYHQIIMNLCANAFHAMEEKGGTLTITLSRETLAGESLLQDIEGIPGRYAHLLVKDNGYGIKKENLDRIFDPYFTTKGRGKGTGMGLSIVHGIVKSHGGFVRLESREGEGASFHVYMPLIEEKAEEKKEVFPVLFHGSESLLLVDDEELLLEMGRGQLEMMGYTVTIAQSSVEALQIFSSQPHAFDLVITDQTMPVMTGVELARRMLAIRQDLPVILCTGYSPGITKETVLKLGIKELALKPLAIDEVSRLVRQTLDAVTAISGRVSPARWQNL